MWIATLVTQIPLEASRNDTTERRSRPPWIRPVRKKAPSVAHSNASNDSPSQHSSPEGFSPSDAFLDLSGGNSTSPQVNGRPFTPSTATPGAQSHTQNPFLMGSNSSSDGSHPPSSGPPSTFMDTGNVDLISNESALSISSADILALFNDGGVDVASLLMSPDLPGRRHSTDSHMHSDFYGSISGSGMDTGPAVGIVSP